MITKLKHFLSLHFFFSYILYFRFLLGTLTSIIILFIFIHSAEYLTQVFRNTHTIYPYLVFVTLPPLYALVVISIKQHCSYALGSGIPHSIVSYDSGHKYLRDKFFHLINVLIKIFSVLLASLFGAPLGSTGPSSYIGSALYFQCIKNSAYSKHITRKSIIHTGIALGSSTGIIVALSAPLAGISFAIEELARNSKKIGVGIIIVFSLVVYILYLIINSLVFNTPMLSLHHLAPMQGTFSINNILYIVPIVLISSTIAALFTKISLLFIGIVEKFSIKKLIPFLLGIGLIIALANYFSNGLVAGTGRDEIIRISQGESLGVEFLLFKFIAVISSFTSLIPGGIFMPSITIGASIGENILSLFSVHLDFIIIIAMISYLSGVSRTPITAALVIIEITGSYTMLPIAIIIAYISNQITKYIEPRALYYELAKKL